MQIAYLRGSLAQPRAQVQRSRELYPVGDSAWSGAAQISGIQRMFSKDVKEIIETCLGTNQIHALPRRPSWISQPVCRPRYPFHARCPSINLPCPAPVHLEDSSLYKPAERPLSALAFGKIPGPTPKGACVPAHANATESQGQTDVDLP
jgi:hypothetical protein